MTDTTMDNINGDGSNHAACPRCGNCLVCDKCTCNMTEEEKKAHYDSYFKYVAGRQVQ